MFENNSDSSSDEEEHGSKEYIVKTKYTIVLVDCTLPMKDDVQKCLTDLYKLYTTLQFNARATQFKSGVITIGGELTGDDAVLLRPNTWTLDKLKSVLDQFNAEKLTKTKLPLKEGIEVAVDVLTQCTKVQDSKTILVVTSNPTPEFDSADDTLSASRMLVLNDIDFVMLPYTYFTHSKFYNSFFKQLREGTCELVAPTPSFLHQLCEQLGPPPTVMKTRIYYNDDNYYEMKQVKLFQRKYRSLGKMVQLANNPDLQAVKWTQEVDEHGFHARKLVKVDDDGDPKRFVSIVDQEQMAARRPTFDKMCKIGANEQKVVFTKAELAELDRQCAQPKQKSLYLMYVDDATEAHVISDDVKTRLLTSGNLQLDKTVFRAQWEYCVKHQKVLYCLYLTKRRSFVILKPILFRNRPRFIQYAIGYVNNYRNTIDAAPPPSTNDALDGAMEQIVTKLNTGKSFLDFRDGKLVYEEALQAAKINKTEFQYSVDELTMETLKVDEIIGAKLVQECQQALIH